jgi:hypothetical protein
MARKLNNCAKLHFYLPKQTSFVQYKQQVCRVRVASPVLGSNK